MLCAMGCAKQGAPVGGPKDTKPPGIDTLRSSPNFVTRFSGNTIRLTFDEWITLSDVSNQVLVSPPLTVRPLPDISLRGKTVTVKFPEGEVLRPNTTYTIHFGSAVKDLHEGNPAANLRYVFSTGDYIDSLRVKGEVRSALTGTGVEKITVALYDNTEDSVVRKQKPTYIAVTGPGGTYLIENVRAGDYKIAAIEDLSRNLKWEDGNERIAFQSTPLQVRDTLTRVPPLMLFSNKPVARRPDADARTSGIVRLRYNTLSDTLRLQVEAPPTLQWMQERVKDTVLVWYRNTGQPTDWQIRAGRDTVRVKPTDPLPARSVRFAEDPPPSASSGKFNRGKPADPVAPAVQAPPKIVPQLPSKPALLDFATPVVSWDTSRWVILKDSVPTRAFQVFRDSLSPRRLHIAHSWKGEGNAVLYLLPKALTDFYGDSNADTLQRIFSLPPLKQLGGLNLTVNRLKPGSRYVLRLMESENVVEERRFTSAEASMRFVFSQLRPITYSVQLIEDVNGNGRWDTGDYYRHQQPESLYLRQLEPLRSNWEVETNMEATYEATPKPAKKL